MEDTDIGRVSAVRTVGQKAQSALSYYAKRWYVTVVEIETGEAARLGFTREEAARAHADRHRGRKGTAVTVSYEERSVYNG